MCVCVCVYVCVLVTQSCLTLCNPMDSLLPGSSVHGILHARILEWVAIPFSRDPSDPGTEPRSPALQADSLLSESEDYPKQIICNIKEAKVNKLLKLKILISFSSLHM